MDTEEQRDHRPMPGPGDTDNDADTKTDDAETGTETGSAPQPNDSDDAGDAGDGDGADDKPEIPEPKEGEGKIALDRSDESQDFVDQSKIDFDPDKGLYSGTAVDGTSEIPGPHAEDGDEGSVLEQAKEMAGDDPPESEGQIGTMMRSRSKKDEEGGDEAEESASKDDRTPDSSDEQAYN